MTLVILGNETVDARVVQRVPQGQARLRRVVVGLAHPELRFSSIRYRRI